MFHCFLNAPTRGFVFPGAELDSGTGWIFGRASDCREGAFLAEWLGSVGVAGAPRIGFRCAATPESRVGRGRGYLGLTPPQPRCVVPTSAHSVRRMGALRAVFLTGNFTTADMSSIIFIERTATESEPERETPRPQMPGSSVTPHHFLLVSIDAELICYP